MSYESVVSSLAPVGRWKLDETSGNAIDSIGGNDGTFGAGITQGGEPAVAGGSSYEGSGASTALIKADTGITAYPYTMAVWFKSTTVTDTILSLGSKSVAEYTDIRLTGTGQLNLRTLDSGGGSNVDANNAANANDGEWHLVVAVVAADNSKTIYYDAEDGAENTSTRVFPTGDVELAIMGRPSGTSATALDGHTSEALLFDKALTATEVQSLYLAGRPPVLRYKLELSASAIDSALTDYATRVGTASITTAQNTALFSTDTGSGADVWFSSDEAGTLPIDGKLVYWDDSTSKFAFDVEITSVSAVSGATIYLQVGSKPGGYGTDPYRAAVEFVMSDSDFTDLTSNGNDGTASGGVTAGGVTGPDGHTVASNFDGSDDYVSTAVAVTYPFTIQAFVNLDTDVASVAVSPADASASNQYLRIRYASDVLEAESRGGATISESTATLTDGDTGNWHLWTGVYAGESSRTIYLDGVAATTDTTTVSPTGLDRVLVGATGDTSPNNYLDGNIANVSVYSEARTAAEINADYLLQGSTASSYWTVTDVTPGLPDATFELRSDGVGSPVVLSGSDVTSWGNASGGTSPTYSNAPADKVLGFPAIQFAVGSSHYLVWNEIASLFSGDDPDFTAAFVIKPGTFASTQAFLSTGNGSAGRAMFSRVTGPNAEAARRDDTSTTDLLSSGMSAADDTPYLFIVKSEGGVGSSLIRRLDTDAEESDSQAYDVASTTMTRGGIGCWNRESGQSLFFDGDIFRIRLYNTALGGDLTGDLTGTQLGQLKDEMLLTAPGPQRLQQGKLSGIIGAPLRGRIG